MTGKVREYHGDLIITGEHMADLEVYGQKKDTLYMDVNGEYDFRLIREDVQKFYEFLGNWLRQS